MSVSQTQSSICYLSPTCVCCCYAFTVMCSMCRHIVVIPHISEHWEHWWSGFSSQRYMDYFFQDFVWKLLMQAYDVAAVGLLRHILSPLHNLSLATNCIYVGGTFRRLHAQFDAWRQNVLQWHIRFWGDKMCRVTLHILSSLIGWTQTFTDKFIC